MKLLMKQSGAGNALGVLASLAIVPVQGSIEDSSILPLPPMGFNNWARFMCNLNQSLFVETVDAMATNGLLDAGYDRINIDDCWLQHERAPNGSLQWNETLFPKGLVWLGEYVKSKGFHFGIYEDAGNATCGGYPGSRGHEELDAKTFQSWGIDYLKLDGCNVYPETEETYHTLYSKWHKTLASLQQPLVFSESAPAYFSGTENNTDWYEVMDWVPLNGELARHSDDIAVYGSYEDTSAYWKSMLTNYGFEVLLARYQAPGYYNDPDFIIADWPWLTLDEKKSQFGLWASFSAPLIISAYIPGLTGSELAFLTNKDVIAIDQDPLALQATLVSQDAHFDVLTKSLANGDRLLTVFNHGDEANSTSVSMERMGLAPGRGYTARDLWTGESSTVSRSVDVHLRRHATALYRISGVSSVVTPTGMIFNTASKKCMTAMTTTRSSITFSNCTGSDAQVWTVSPDRGQIASLAAPGKCLDAAKSGVALNDCESGARSSEWVYHVTGNVVNAESGLCLQQGGGFLGQCGQERDRQVFGLPSGVRVVRARAEE